MNLFTELPLDEPAGDTLESSASLRCSLLAPRSRRVGSSSVDAWPVRATAVRAAMVV
jgi:hypothetical protein